MNNKIAFQALLSLVVAQSSSGNPIQDFCSVQQPLDFEYYCKEKYDVQPAPIPDKIVRYDSKDIMNGLTTIDVVTTGEDLIKACILEKKGEELIEQNCWLTYENTTEVKGWWAVEHLSWSPVCPEEQDESDECYLCRSLVTLESPTSYVPPPSVECIQEKFIDQKFFTDESDDDDDDDDEKPRCLRTAPTATVLINASIPEDARSYVDTENNITYWDMGRVAAPTGPLVKKCKVISAGDVVLSEKCRMVHRDAVEFPRIGEVISFSEYEGANRRSDICDYTKLPNDIVLRECYEPQSLENHEFTIVKETDEGEKPCFLETPVTASPITQEPTPRPTNLRTPRPTTKSSKGSKGSRRA